MITSTYIPIVDFEKWCLKFLNDFDVIVHVVLDCQLKSCKTFNGHSARLCFMCVRRCIEAFFGIEIDKDLLCQNMSKTQFQKIDLTFAF